MKIQSFIIKFIFIKLLKHILPFTSRSYSSFTVNDLIYIFCASPAYTSIVLTYFMGSYLSLRLVEQQQKQLAVRLDSIVVICKVKNWCSRKIELVVNSEGHITEPNSLLDSIKDQKS